MKAKNHSYVIVVEENSEGREDLMHSLASLGYLVNGLSNPVSTIKFLDKSFVVPNLLLISEEFSSAHQEHLNNKLLSELRFENLKLLKFKRPIDTYSLMLAVEKSLA